MKGWVQQYHPDKILKPPKNLCIFQQCGWWCGRKVKMHSWSRVSKVAKIGGDHAVSHSSHGCCTRCICCVNLFYIERRLVVSMWVTIILVVLLLVVIVVKVHLLSDLKRVSEQWRLFHAALWLFLFVVTGIFVTCALLSPVIIAFLLYSQLAWVSILPTLL